MLDYVTHGKPEHPALLLLHAGGLTRHEWEPFVAAWARHFYLIMPSALGHGASPTVPELSIRALAEATLELLDELGIEQAHLLGSSMGGATALWIARHHPARVARLILFRTSYRSTPALYAEVQRMAEPALWREWRLDRQLSEQHAPQGGPEAWIEVTRKVARAFDPAHSEHAHTLEALATLPQRTLLITGDRDPVVPLADMVALYQTIPDAALWVLPHATHFMGTEGWRRAAFEQEILRFLRRG